MTENFHQKVAITVRAGGTPLDGLCGDVPLDRIRTFFFASLSCTVYIILHETVPKGHGCTIVVVENGLDWRRLLVFKTCYNV